MGGRERGRARAVNLFMYTYRAPRTVLSPRLVTNTYVPPPLRRPRPRVGFLSIDSLSLSPLSLSLSLSLRETNAVCAQGNSSFHSFCSCHSEKLSVSSALVKEVEYERQTDRQTDTRPGKQGSGSVGRGTRGAAACYVFWVAWQSWH